MKLKDLSPEVVQQLAAYRFDEFIWKYEGPWDWELRLQEQLVEFLGIYEYEVLLPMDKEHHPNITVSRCVASADKQTLTIFLSDTTYDYDPDMPMTAGYLVVYHSDNLG